MWASIELSEFSLGIRRERLMKPSNMDLIGGGGASTPVWSYGEALALVGSHL
jgi:hypothetical protein